MANKISSLMPDLNCPRLEVLLKENKPIAALYDSDPEFKEVYDDAIDLQDCIASTGVHACGAIIADEPLYNYVPLWDSKGQPVTQYEGGPIEELGLVKLDVLGLKTLSVLNTAKRLIHERTGDLIDIYSLPVDDPSAYKIMWEGQNVGIFQFEGVGISGFVNSCKPKTIHDLAVITAVYRPKRTGA